MFVIRSAVFILCCRYSWRPVDTFRSEVAIYKLHSISRNAAIARPWYVATGHISVNNIKRTNSKAWNYIRGQSYFIMPGIFSSRRYLLDISPASNRCLIWLIAGVKHYRHLSVRNTLLYLLANDHGVVGYNTSPVTFHQAIRKKTSIWAYGCPHTMKIS